MEEGEEEDVGEQIKRWVQVVVEEEKEGGEGEGEEREKQLLRERKAGVELVLEEGGKT